MAAVDDLFQRRPLRPSRWDSGNVGNGLAWRCPREKAQPGDDDVHYRAEPNAGTRIGFVQAVWWPTAGAEGASEWSVSSSRKSPPMTVTFVTPSLDPVLF